MRTFFDMDNIHPDEYEYDDYKWQFTSDLREVIDYKGSDDYSSNYAIYDLLKTHDVCDSVDCDDTEFGCTYLYFNKKSSAEQFIQRLNAFLNDHPEYLRQHLLEGDDWKWEIIKENLEDIIAQISSIRVRPAGLLGHVEKAARQIQEEILDKETGVTA